MKSAKNKHFDFAGSRQKACALELWQPGTTFA